MICTRLLAVGILAAIPAFGWSYDNAFTLEFEQATDIAGWSDATNGNNAIFAGENMEADIVDYNPKPEDAPGYNGTNWLRIGADVNEFGVGTYVYDGSAGGTTQEILDFVATVDVFVVPNATFRYQVALFGRWTSSVGNAPFEVFYSRNTPSSADGFGWRQGGSTTTYNAFTTTTVTSPQWVRMKMEWKEDNATVAIDEDLDNVYEYVSPVQTPVNQTVAGKLGLQCVINDPNNGHARVPDQFAYFDNFTFAPIATVRDWSMY